jgi:hypothetical protein
METSNPRVIRELQVLDSTALRAELEESQRVQELAEELLRMIGEEVGSEPIELHEPDEDDASVNMVLR